MLLHLRLKASIRLRVRPGTGSMIRRLGIFVERHFDEFSLDEQRRESGRAEQEVAFVHDAKTPEEKAPFLVDGVLQRIGKRG